MKRSILKSLCCGIAFTLGIVLTANITAYAQGQPLPTFQQIMASLFQQRENNTWALKANTVNSETVIDGSITAVDLAPDALNAGFAEIITITEGNDANPLKTMEVNGNIQANEINTNKFFGNIVCLNGNCQQQWPLTGKQVATGGCTVRTGVLNIPSCQAWGDAKCDNFQCKCNNGKLTGDFCITDAVPAP